jgi:hypothetical protein
MNNESTNIKTFSYITKSGEKIAYHDINGELVSIGDFIEIQYNSGQNQGSPNKITGILTKINDFGYLTLDGSESVRPNNVYDYTDNLGVIHFKGLTKSHGWEFWIKKITIN